MHTIPYTYSTTPGSNQKRDQYGNCLRNNHRSVRRERYTDIKQSSVCSVAANRREGIS